MKPALQASMTVILMTALSGCNVSDLSRIFNFNFHKKEPVVETAPVVEDKNVKDVELAKVILKPKHLSLKVTRDPFAPLLVGSNENAVVPADVPLNEQILKDLQFLGLINMGDQPFALISVENVSKVYKVGDMIKSLSVAEIHADHIVLQKDNKTIKLNRGDKK
ncbi:MAG: hypothetical protein JNN05_08605 [Candidatus Omnitrophica bacterium]|nr:hypothetical protein [Candidatus Omnitrophota bacterium]